MMAFSHSMGQMIFLLTPLREGRRCSRLCSARARRAFLLTPLREGRRRCPIWSTRSAKFLLTPLREGRPAPQLWPLPLCCHFYSRPCGRGDLLRNCGRCHCAAISTHAPAGGATQVQLYGFCRLVISTHAPAGGATRPQRLVSRHLPDFYSRPCGRGDASFCP